MHDAWKRLEACFVSNLSSSYHQVNTNMSTLRMQEGETILAYWARALGYRRRCYEVGIPVPQKQWFSSLLQGLPHPYAVIRQYWTQQLDTLIEQHLLQVLREEEGRLKLNKKGNKGSGDALQVDGKGKRSGGKSKGKGNSEQGEDKKKKDQKFQPKRIGRDGEWGELGPA